MKPHLKVLCRRGHSGDLHLHVRRVWHTRRALKASALKIILFCLQIFPIQNIAGRKAVENDKKCLRKTLTGEGLSSFYSS